MMSLFECLALNDHNQKNCESFVVPLQECWARHMVCYLLNRGVIDYNVTWLTTGDSRGEGQKRSDDSYSRKERSDGGTGQHPFVSIPPEEQLTDDVDINKSVLWLDANCFQGFR